MAKVIPEMTQVALATHKPEIGREYPDAAKKEFLYHLSRADYEREFSSRYRHPGIFARILGFFIKLVPFGPAKILGYRNPTPLTEDYYFRSMDRVLAQYHRLIEQANAANRDFPNLNLDTGYPTRKGEYALADQTYADLVQRLARDHFVHLTPAVQRNILAYFAGGEPANGSLKPSAWRKTAMALLQLRSAHAGAPAAKPAPPPSN